ncbi:MAG: transcriptional regulator [Deltaproteobacteria bacterium]|nr:transcriptional regulator [Deltaproteobacteria bacterium]
MDWTPRKLLTVIAEAALERRLAADFGRLGAQGYTAWPCRGQGHRGLREGEWEPSSNVCFQIVCDEATADRVAAHLLATYYADFGIVVHLGEVTVLRPEKF